MNRAAASNVTQLFERTDQDAWPFMRFWYAYPKKVAKIAAQRAWARLRPGEREACLKRLPIMLRYWDRTETLKQFMPHPATFLNERRWEDEVEGLDEPATDLGQCFWNRNANRDPSAGQCTERAVAQDDRANCYCEKHARSLGLKVKARAAA